MKKKYIVCLFIFFTVTSPLQAQTVQNTLRPFVTDGCSNWPDGTPADKKKWQHCCIKHDRLYWMGGTQNEKNEADRALDKCVSKSFSPIMGIITYIGVKIGGSANLATPYRWGYGWKYNRGYRPLGIADKSLVAALEPQWVEIPINIKIEKGQKPVAYPTATGDYCVDELTLALKKIHKDANIKILKPVDQNGFLEFETDICDQDLVMAHFAVQDGEVCRKPHYTDEAPQLLTGIFASKSCKLTK